MWRADPGRTTFVYVHPDIAVAFLYRRNVDVYEIVTVKLGFPTAMPPFADLPDTVDPAELPPALLTVHDATYLDAVDFFEEVAQHI